MKIFLRISSAVAALLILAGTVYLGILSGTDNDFVVWFGIASAIVTPVGFSLLSYAFSSSDAEIFQRLSKVPEIEKLVAEAKTQEEKVRVLQEQQQKLEETIRLESKRLAAKDRVESLERDASRIVAELDSLDSEVKALDLQIDSSIAIDELNRLRERVVARSRGDIVLQVGGKVYRVDRDVIKALPFGMGNITLAYARVVQRFLDRREAGKRRSDGDSAAV